MSKIDITEEYLNIILNIFKKYLIGTNSKIYAFGSRAKQTAKPYSDLDLAIDMSKSKLPIELEEKIKLELEDTNISYKVDIIDLNSITDSFRQNIASDLIEIFSIE